MLFFKNKIENKVKITTLDVVKILFKNLEVNMKKNISKILILLIFQLFNCSFFQVLSQEGAIDIGEIVVTGVKIEKQLKDLPFSVNVLKDEEIFKKPVIRAEEIVKSIPGVHSITPHVGTHGAFVTMRGHALTKQVVSLDGQPINDGYNGYVRWGILPTVLWDRIEVIRGPFSVFYGPYGMGGVINFVPKKKLIENQLKILLGSFRTHSVSILYGGEIKNKTNFIISFEDKDIEGYVGDFVVIKPTATQPAGSVLDVTGWERTSLSTGDLAYKIGHRGRQYSREQKNLYLGISHSINQNQEISLNYLYARQKHGFEGYETYLKDVSGKFVESGNIKITDGTNTYFSAISTLNFLDMEGICGQDVVSLRYTNRLNSNLKLKLFSGLNTRVQEWTSGTSGATSSGGPGRKGTPEGISTRFGLEGEIKFGRNTLVLGSEVTLNSAGAKRETLSNWKDRKTVIKLEEDAKGKSKITSGYLNFEFIPLQEKVTVWAGARYDSWKSYEGKMITTTKETSFPFQTTSKFNPKLGILYKLNRDFLLKTSYGGGFRVPGPHELYREVIVPTSVSLGNPELKPETNKCGEIAIEYKPTTKESEIKSLKVNYFSDIIKNLIYMKTWKASHPDSGEQVSYTQRQNAGKGKTIGYEIEIEGNPQWIRNNIKVSWLANASLQRPKITENITSPKTVGKVIPYVPKKMYNLEVVVEKEKLSFVVSMHSRSKVYIQDDNSDVVNGVPGSMDPFTTFDAKFGYKINEKNTFAITINNLFDKEYYSMHNQKAPGRGISTDLIVRF